MDGWDAFAGAGPPVASPAAASPAAAAPAAGDAWGAFAGSGPAVPPPAAAAAAAAAAAPPPPLIDYTATEGGPAYAAPAPASPAPGDAAVERIGKAAADAFRDTPSILNPAGEAAVDEYRPLGLPVGQALINPALKVAAGVIPGPWNSTMNAGIAGASQAAEELLGSRGGHDAQILALALGTPGSGVHEAGPLARAIMERRAPSVAEPAVVPTGTPAQAALARMPDRVAPPDVSELGPYHAIKTLIEHDTAQNPPVVRAPGYGQPVADVVPTAPTTEGGPVAAPVAGASVPGQSYAEWLQANRMPDRAPAPADNVSAPVGAPAAAASPDNVSAPVGADGAPVPQSVGAAAAGDNGLGEVSPAQQHAYAATAEGQKLLERQPVGVPDHSAYIPGENPTDVERLQTVDAARELKALKVTAPGLADVIQKVSDENLDKRQGYLQETIGSKNDLRSATDAREAQRVADYPAAFADKTTPDTAPVVQAVQDSLNSPAGRQNTQLQQYVAPLLKRLVNEDGSPKITDAEELYGLRQDISRMRSKASQVDQPNLQHVSGELGDIVTATDAAIEKAAPGYRNLMDNFAGASRKIDEMRVLQDHEPGLYDAGSRLGYAKFQTMMRKVVDQRGEGGVNPYKSITPETMQRLWNLRDSLRRSAKAQELGSAPGSDTAQTAFDMVKNAAKGHVGTMAAGAVGGVLGGFVGMPTFGMVAGGVTKEIAASMFDKRVLARQTARGMEMLRPTSPLNDLLPGEVEPPVRPAFAPTAAAARPPAVAPAQGAMALPPGGAPVNALAEAPRAAPVAPPAAAAPANALLPPAPRVRVPAGSAPAAAGARAPFSFPLTDEESASMAAANGPPAAPAAPAVPAAQFGGRPSAGEVVPAGQLGPVRKVTTPGGQSVDVRYRVVEAKDLIASHSPEGTPNPAYDQSLQPRDRSRMASVLQIQRYANNPNASLLGESPSTAMGAPIGHADMQVKSGNGRAATIQEAYRLGNGNVIRKGVQDAGYDTAGFNQPALYGEIQTPMDHAQGVAFARDAGGSPIAGSSATERAVSDAKALPNDAYALLRGGDVSLAKNTDFARAFSDALPPGEREGFMTADGEVSAEGAARMRNALTQHAYGSDSLVSSMAEHADPDLKAFGGAMVDASGDMAKLRAGIAGGTIDPGADLAPALVEASRFIQAAKRQRVSLADAVSQRDAFAPHNPMVDAVLKEAFGPDLRGRMTRSKFASLLSDYADNAAVQSGLFGAKESAGELLAASGSRYGYGTKTGATQPGLYGGMGGGSAVNR